MADNIIKVNVTANKTQRVTVSSANVGTEITASSDTGKFWAQNAKNWAVSENIVDGEDYSSKYYANKSKGYAQNAESFEVASRETYDNIVTKSESTITEIEELKEISEQEISVAVADGLTEINNKKNTAISDLEFVSEGEKDEIKDLANLIKENAEDIANRTSFAMFDTILKDHVLTYEESKGLALQGTWVYKEAVAGSRYGYPDFYNKCLEEYNESVGERWVQPVLTANGVLGGNTFAVSANGEASNTPAYKMFDNDNSTYWYGATNGKGYVTLYNPTPLNIVNLKITNSQWVEDNIATGEILVSNNGTDWAKILTFTGNTASNATWEIDLNTNGGFYKYYKINILSLGSTSYPPAIVNLEIITGNLVKNTNGHLFYDIADKDIIDSIFESTGVAWFYGIDQENERIFLPRNNYFEQMTGDVSEVGKSIEAGLPNITGKSPAFRGCDYISGGTGAIYMSSTGNGAQAGVNTSVPVLNFDASRSNPIYGNSDTVQPNAVKKLLYICVGNTEVTSTVTDVVEVTTTENDTLPLFTAQYFDFTPNNVSWLKAGEQSNSGGAYTFCYNELVNELTSPKYNLKVINETDMIAGVDYSEYWKVNQEDMTFITPTAISNKALSGAVVGNGMTLGLTDGSNNYGVIENSSNNLVARTTAWDKTVGTSVGDSGSMDDNKVVGITTDPAKSGIIAEQSTAQLYFKVANAVQNLELLDAGEVLEAVNNVVPNNSSLISSYAMPSNKYIDLTLGASGTTYTAPANGWFYLSKTAGSDWYFAELSVVKDGQTLFYIYADAYRTSACSVIIPVKKGDNVKAVYNATGTTNYFRFIYAEGE
jgi:hypothetical protein